MNVSLPDSVFNVQNQESFSEIALEIFNLQCRENVVYRDFISTLGKREVRNINEIPFLPAEIFRSREVITGKSGAEMIFESSTTSGSIPSRHFVYDLKIYEESFIRAFTLFYGNPDDFFIAALLPSYTERKHSSLVYMMEGLIKRSKCVYSGFYGGKPADLIKKLQDAKKQGQKAILIGVSFALLDLAEQLSPDLSGIIIMETGGMKGRRKEITRKELHEILTKKMNVPVIHSEYGMTELLSQAYSKGDGIFYTPPWMRILIRDPHDPLTIINESGRPGGINIIDLANVYSCSFIASGDYGILHENGGFEVMGRFDNSDVRGCNLMAG
jgi:hypothetical protein